MDNGFSFFNGDGFSTIAPALLQTVLDSITTGIEVLKAVRDDGHISGFEYVVVNEAARNNNGHEAVVGKNFLTDTKEKKYVFEKMKEVVETEQPFFTTFSKKMDGSVHQFNEKYVKFEDGVLISREDVTGVKKTDGEFVPNDSVERTPPAAKTARAQKPLGKAEEKYGQKLEQDIRERTGELDKNKDLLQATIDSSLDVIQVFKSVRNRDGRIIDFTWEMNNKKGVEQNGDVIGKSVLEKNPGVTETGIFDKMVEVAETGVPVEHEQYYKQEQFDGWFYQAIVRTGDGVVMTTRDVTQQKKTQEEILRLKDEVAQKVTDKYYSVFNSIDEGFCIQELIYDDDGQIVDLRIVEANPAYEKQTGLKKDVIGRLHSELGLATESYWFEIYDRIAKTGKPESFENWHEPTGRWYHAFLSRIGGEDSRQLAVVFNDITERKLQEQHQAYLLKLSDAIRPLSDAKEIEDTACRLLGEHLNVNRVYFPVLNEEKDTAIVERQYLRTGASSMSGTYSLAAFSWSIHILKTNQAVIVDNIYESEIVPGYDVAAMEAIQQISVVAVPLLKNGKLTGALTVSENKLRKWKPQEVELIRETQERMWAAAERARTEEALKQSEEKYRTLFDSIDEGYVILEIIYNEAGEPFDIRYLETNKVFQRQSGLDDWVGKTVLEVVPNIEPEWLAFYFNVARTGEASRIEYHLDQLNRWFSTYALSVGGAGSPLVAAVFYDITERKFQEQRKEFFLKLNDVLRPTIDPVTIRNEAMRLLRNHLGSTLVAYSEVSEDEEFVTPIAEDRDPKFISMLGVKFRWTDLEPEGAARFRRRESIHRNDIENDPELPAKHKAAFAAIAIGSYIVTPLVKDGKLVACLAAYNTTAHTWTPDEIHLVEEVAERTWVTIEKAKAEEALRKSEQSLAKELKDAKQLQQFSNQLIHFNDEENIHEILLDTAMKLMQSDFASFQLYAPQTESLSLAAHRNFHRRSAEFWQTVFAGSGSVWGEALRSQSRILVSDIEAEDFAKNELEIFRLSGIRAIQSTPIISRSGKLIGMLNTQWKEPRKFSDGDFLLFDVLVRQAADLIERKHAEDALRKSEQQLKEFNLRLEKQVEERTKELTESTKIVKEQANYIGRITATVPDMISVTELESKKFTFINTPVFIEHGFNPESMSNKSPEELDALIHPDDRKILDHYFDSFFNATDEDVVTAEYRAKNDKGKWSWFRVRGKVFQRNERNKPTHILNVIQNISHQKEAEQKIKEDTHFIGQILETTPDILYIMDLNTHQLIYCNRQIAAELGYSKEQIARMKNPLMDIMHPDDISRFKDHLKKIKSLTSDDKVIEIEYRLKTAKGGFSWFCDRNSVFKRNSRKIPVEKIGFAQNITDRKEREEQLLTGVNILNQAEEISGMGTWEYDIATDAFKWSEGMYKLFNLPKYIRPHPEIYLDYTPENEKEVVERIVQNITRDFNSFEEVITLLPDDQPARLIAIKAVAITDDTMEPVKMIGVDLDITAQKKATDEIDALNQDLLDKNRELGSLNAELKSFNTITASDYKNTLQILYTNLEFIASHDGRRLGDASKANIRRAQSAIQKMKLLTDDINNYLQLYEMGISKSMIDPNGLIETLTSSLGKKIEQHNATIQLMQLPPLYADPYLFSQLISEIINNAMKYSKLTTPLVIKIRYSRADEMNAVAGAIKNVPYTIISIADNGLGFFEAETEKIFELFYRPDRETGQFKGSGIGLAACKKIMSMHHGFITAESIPGSGATFNCYFPDQP